MNGDDKSKIKKVRILSLSLLLVIIIIVISLAITLISGNFTGSSQNSGLFSRRIPPVTVDEFNFDVGRNRMFASIPSHAASAGTLGIQVLDMNGNETLRDSFRMSQPVITASNNRFISYDIGGSSVRVFNSSRVISSFEAEGVIVSASVNNNGWFCVVSQTGGGNKGTVTVYNNNGAAVFSVDMRTGFALSAELSPDNKNLAVLNLTDDGSRVTFYVGIEINDEPKHIFDLPDGLIIDIKYLSDGDLLAISTDLLFIIDDSGTGRSLYPFPDKRLGSYSNDDTFIALHLYDYGIGHRGRIVTLRSDGTVFGELPTDREIISMSVRNKSLIVLKNDGVVFYNDELEEFSSAKNNFSAAGSTRVLAVREDTALATNDSFAVIFTREEER